MTDNSRPPDWSEEANLDLGLYGTAFFSVTLDEHGNLQIRHVPFKNVCIDVSRDIAEDESKRVRLVEVKDG